MGIYGRFILNFIKIIFICLCAVVPNVVSYFSNGLMNVMSIVSNDFLSSLNLSYLIILILAMLYLLYNLCVNANFNNLTYLCLNVCGTSLPGFVLAAYKEVGVA